MKEYFSNIKKYTVIILIFIFLSTPVSFVFSGELNSTNYIIQEYNFDTGNEMTSTSFSVTGNITQGQKGLFSVSNLPLIAGVVSTCGKINTSGTYTLAGDIEGISSGPCFIVAADNVTIDGAGYTVSATGSNSSYAVTATSSTVGGSAYGTTTIKNITFTGFAGGVNASGYTVTSGVSDGGDGGILYVENSTLGLLTVSGGDSINDGGDAGSLYIVDTNAFVASTTASATGGDSTSCGYGGSGGFISIIDSPDYVSDVSAGVDQIEIIANGGNCANPPSGNSGSAGRVDVFNTPTTDGGSPGSAAGVDGGRSGIRSLLDGILPEIKFNINLPKLTLLPIPRFGTGEDSFSFIDKIANFFAEDTLNSLKERFNSTPDLLSYLNINSVYDLFLIQNNPRRIKDTNKPGLFTIFNESKEKKYTTYVTASKQGDIAQLIRVHPNQKIHVSLMQTGENVSYTALFNGNEILFNDNSVEILSPDKVGRYTLSSSVTPMLLYVDVIGLDKNIVFDSKNIFIIFIEKILDVVHKIVLFLLLQIE